MKRFSYSIFAFVLVITVFACERTPEDLEDWRDAKNGVEKLKTWTADKTQPAPVRQRALELLVIDKHYEAMSDALESLNNESTRKDFVNEVVPTIRDMWEKQDLPTSEEIEEAKDNGGGKIEVKDSKAVAAKDAAYYLYPYASSSARSFFRDIFNRWLSEDWEVRDQLGNVSLEQLISHVDSEGARHLLDWMQNTKQPGYVTELANQSGASEIQDGVAKELSKRLHEKHPDINKPFRDAMLVTESTKLVDYLEKAISSEDSSAELIADAIDALSRIQKEKAVPFFKTMIHDKKGKLRWIAAQRVIELRGKAGFLIATKSLPLEPDQYADKEGAALKDNAEFFCNFFQSEMERTNVASIEHQLRIGLKHDKWPVKLLSAFCARQLETTYLKDELKALADDTTDIPGWGGESNTVGEVAQRTVEMLN